MTSILRLRRRLNFTDDRGIALPTVFGLGLVMLMMVATALSLVTGGLKKTASDQDWNGALAAAYAGVEEYQSRLANDSTYQKYGDPTAPFTAATTSTVSLPTGTNANPAFGVGATGTWAKVASADPSTPVIATYRYEIDNSDYINKGVLHLRSTGRVGNVTRSIVADLKQSGFIDYLYFTNYETPDPAYVGGYAATIDTGTGASVCEKYNYAPNARSSNCTELQFFPGDTFAGPVRSNDKLVICGTTFEGPVLTSSTASPIYKTGSGGCGSGPDFQVGSGPVYIKPIGMPQTNTEMKKETRNDLASDVPRPGCLYTGPTVITFTNDGKMNVTSPWTKKTNIAATTAGASNPIQCGQPGTNTGQLGSPGGAKIAVLNLNLLYVQAVPAAGSDDPNAPAVGTLPTGFTCPTATGSAPAGWMFKDVGTGTVINQYPAVGEVTPTGATTLKHYDCRAGDIYVKGTLKGQTTLAADNFIYVVDNLLYSDQQSDVLGLVGQNAVLVYNPRNSANKSLTGTTWMDREIDGAILSVGHTFQVQNYDQFPRGTLTVFGAIAQKFRGAVVSGTNGFTKDYQYDTRYRTTAPPKFLTPVSTTYGVTQYATVRAGFNPDGSIAKNTDGTPVL